MAKPAPLPDDAPTSYSALISRGAAAAAAFKADHYEAFRALEDAHLRDRERQGLSLTDVERKRVAAIPPRDPASVQTPADFARLSLVERGALLAQNPEKYQRLQAEVSRPFTGNRLDSTSYFRP